MVKAQISKQSNRNRAIEAKGRGAKRTDHAIPSQVEAGSEQLISQVSKPLTSHTIFLLCIERASVSLL